MQRIYRTLEDYASSCPEQWEGVWSLYRWRLDVRVDRQKEKPPSPQEDISEVSALLKRGQHFRINEPGG
jgi:hypothetical protein